MKRFWFFLFFISSILIKAQEATSNDSVALQPFAVANLTTAAEETDEALRKAREALEKNEHASSIYKRYEQSLEKNVDLRSDTVYEKLELYNLWALTDINNNWTTYENEIEKYKRELSKLSEAYQEGLLKTTNYYDRWKLTKETEASEIPEPLLNRIDGMLSNLKVSNVNLKDSLNNILTYFDIVAQEHSHILNMKQRIQDISDAKKLNIFARDSPPLRAAFKGSDEEENIADQLSGTFNASYERTRNYLADNKGSAEVHLSLTIVFILIFFYFQHIFKKNNPDVSGFDQKAVYLINKPVWVGIILSMFISFWVYQDPPVYFVNIILFCVLISFLFVLNGLVEGKVKYVYYYTALLYTLGFTENFMTSYPLSQRVIVLIQSILVFVGFSYLMLKRSPIQKSKNDAWRKISKRMFPVYLLFSLVAIYGNFTGSLFLARILTKTMVITITVGLMLALIFSIVKSLLDLLMVSNARNYVRLIAKQGDMIKRKVLFYLKLWFYFLWIRTFLSQIGLRSYIADSLTTFMEVGQNFGDVYLSVGQVVNFIIILIIFSIIANIVKDILAIEILPRLNLKKGVPMAAGLMTRYTVLVLGFLMAVAAAGISLDKLGFIAGALGVGIGFGLQNVVGNFVSGLILIFERPVRVDDVISSGTVEGTIVEIGIRASRIRDWDGAEVIVPNMELISQQVTNWTLSDSKRRRELFIKVEYGTDPNKVMEIIKEVIKGHEGVIQDPEPMVLFLGFKEFSADFRILFWVTENMLSTTSDVAVGIYNALKENGISIPIPKREVIEKKDEAKPRKKSTAKKKAVKKTHSSVESKKDEEADSSTEKK
ncbi:MAG: mechanosensitive ion channel [Schleiferiaceae bacterium]|nr:mechanosensitive ion channel [Schleiferiaceae bacterium]